MMDRPHHYRCAIPIHQCRKMPLFPWRKRSPKVPTGITGVSAEATPYRKTCEQIASVLRTASNAPLFSIILITLRTSIGVMASPGEDFSAEKADRSREWKCGYSSETLYAGFPHLFLYSSPKAAERFVNRCAEFRRGRKAEEERS